MHVGLWKMDSELAVGRPGMTSLPGFNQIKRCRNLRGNFAADSLQIAQSLICDSIYDCSESETQCEGNNIFFPL